MNETEIPTEQSGRTMLAHLRHELRTPLNAVIGYSEMLLEDADADEFGSVLRRMLAAGRELLSVVNELLDPAALVQKMAGQTVAQFVATAQRQLRTSLTTVSGYCELLLEEGAETGREEFAADLERIQQAAARFLTLIDSVIDWALVEQEVEQFARANVPASTQTGADASPIPDSLESLRTATGSLLVVDDNEVNRDLLSRRLVREGHQVAEAVNGRQALEMIEQGAFDLVLLDVMMPELNGHEVLEHLQREGRLRDLPVIMLSAGGELESIVQCISLGAEDYLSKPYDPILLRARINASLEKKRLRDRLREQLRAIEQELNVAARIQQSILPRKFPVNEHLEIFAEMTPARAIGGDFYDFFPIGGPNDETRFGFAIADVSGKGAPAALFMALSRAFLKATASEGSEGMSAGECLTRVNRLIQAENHTRMFVTAFYGILNLQTGAVEFANAGHNHPYLLRAGNPPVMLDHRNSLVLGMRKAVEYPTHQLQLQPGDRLFLYTDGVTEAMTEQGEEFSEERLAQALARAEQCSLQETTRLVSDAVREFADGAPQSDDLTMLIVQYNG
ncbi:MAG TPA: SpoIIE family protein phosphatase [Blastocatellia bacterium]|nr:SpoIIE family protein phosphatase [Blastocatellia bacterium]